MNKENCVLRTRNNVIKANRPALVDKNGLNIVKNVNKIIEPIKMSKIRTLRCRTKPRLTEQFPFTRKKSPAKRTNSNNTVEKLPDIKYMKSARVSIVRDTEIEDKVIASIIGVPVRVTDVYEFKYDPKDEPKPRKVKRAKRKHVDSDTSGEEDNSMKDVMKKLRRKAKPLLKKAQSIRTESKKQTEPVRMTSEVLGYTRPPTSLKEAANDNFDDDSADLAADFDFETESSYSRPILNVPYDTLFNKPPSKHTQNTFDALLNETPPIPCPKPARIKSAKDLVQEVVDSFSEDALQESPIKMHSNVLLNSSRGTTEGLPPIPCPPKPIRIKSAKDIVQEVADSFSEDALQESPIKIHSNVLLNSSHGTTEGLPPIPYPPKPIRIKSAKDIVQEVADSFSEDVLHKSPIKIHSNLLLNSLDATEIFNSTMVANNTPLASPWRLNISNIRKNSYCFTVKRTSFTPAYDHDPYIVNTQRKSHVYTNIGINPTSDLPQIVAHATHPTSESSIVPKTHQTSILSFVQSSKPQITPVKSTRSQIGLFDDPIPERSKRRVLGDHNPQTTPIHPNSSAEKSSDDSMFGFSYLSEDEDVNKENVGVKRKCAPTRISLRDVKKTFGAPPIEDVVVDDDLIAEFEQPFDETEEIDSNVGLFQDCEPLEVSKKITRHYARKHTKRKRLISEDSNHSDADESDHEAQPAKKHRQKNAQTKKEEEESNRLAKYYNSMFEEIAQHHLVIE